MIVFAAASRFNRSQFRILTWTYLFGKFSAHSKIEIKRYAFYAFRIYGCLARCSGMMNLGVDQHGPRPIRPWQERIHAFLERTAHATGKHLSWPGRKCEGKKGFFAKKTAGAEPLKDGLDFFLLGLSESRDQDERSPPPRILSQSCCHLWLSTPCH